jgi:hypothetical protein
MVEQPRPVQFPENRVDAARAVHVLDVVLRRVRRDLAQAGDAAGELVDLLEPEVDTRLVRGGQQVQDRVGRAAHGDIESHGIRERGAGGNRARQDGRIIAFVPSASHLDDAAGGGLEHFTAPGVGGD